MRSNAEYALFLTNFRHTKPLEKFVSKINKNAVCSLENRLITMDKVTCVLTKHPDTTFLCLSNNCCDVVNHLATHALFKHERSVLTVPDYQLNKLDLFLGMSIVITENRCKSTRYVNGVVGKLKSYANRTLFLEVGPSVVPVFPVYTSECKLYYPITPAYAFTVNKMQGETLEHVTLVFNKEFAGPGIGYVAISE